MGNQLKAYRYIVLAILFVTVAVEVNGQSLVCRQTWPLKMDSSSLHNLSYPYIRVKRAFPNSTDPHFLVYFQGFYESLLFDIDTVHFELVNLKTHDSKRIKIPVNTVFSEHIAEARYMVNDFAYHDGKLALLVFDCIYLFDANSAGCRFRQKFRLPHGYSWLTFSEDGAFRLLDLVHSDDPQAVACAKFKMKQDRLIQDDSIIIPFAGKPYLQLESQFVSESMDDIFLGNATSSVIYTINKQNGSIDEALSTGHIESSRAIDTLSFRNKMQFFNSLQTMDTNHYHYQTCYVGDQIILRSRTRSAYKTAHYFDVYRRSHNGVDSTTTLLDGLHNYKLKNDTTVHFSRIDFDPISATKGYIAVGNIFYTIGFRYKTERSDLGYIEFPISELRTLGKELYKSKAFEFNVYEYALD